MRPRNVTLDAVTTWTGFNLGLALLPLWIILLFSFPTSEAKYPIRAILDSGALIFYATTLSSQVLLDRWGELRALWNDRIGVDGRPVFWTYFGFLNPLFVIILGVITYAAMISSSEPSALRIVSLQVTILILAVFGSLARSLEVAQRVDFLLYDD